ncbi:MAG: MBL fold metallo-hydrolase [Acidobacteria bacterium]|nr:MBL fold metallo-hydrolase [Acidobacteriota bacterium]
MTSAVAKYLDTRGPGLHHITLRVDDIEGVLGRLRAHGVRLIDESPRPGAEGALVAFVHPSSAHGVLVELKQTPGRAASRSGGVLAPPTAALDASATVPRFNTPTRYQLGALELLSLSDGFFHLDGGAMFGVVPRTLWEKRLPPDRRNRIPLAMRPLIVRGERTLLIDAGCGDKMDAKSADIYGLERGYHLDHALDEAGLAASDIDLVLASHLHFDHVGGFTAKRDDAVVPRFPNARYLAHRQEWEDATHPHERNRASYWPENFVPLAHAGVLALVDDEAEIMPGVRLRRSGGHTRHHQMVMIESRGTTAVFAADMYPTCAHVPDPWVMAYDLYPMETLAFKRQFAREAIEREYLVFFEHEPSMAAGVIRERDGKRTVERVI